MPLPKPEIGAPCNACGLCCQRRVCSAGSFAIGLVSRYGDRAEGPCPALTQDGERWVCGVYLDPHRLLTRPDQARRKTSTLREAWAVLIGVGIGCDEAGDEPDETALPKLGAVQARFLARYSRAAIRRAARLIHKSAR